MSHVLDEIKVDMSCEVTLAEQLKQQFTWLIASGRLEPGDHLPSVRELSQRLCINMHTVRSAYRKMANDGIAETRQGVGTIVTSSNLGDFTRQQHRVSTHTIGVILPGLGNPFYHAFLQGIEECIHLERAMLFVCNAHDDVDEARRYFAQLSAKKVDGVILASLDVSVLLNFKSKARKTSLLPIVSVDWPDSDSYSILVDLEGAGYMAAHHLIEHGHRRVGLITFKEDAANVVPINAGYKRALLEGGLPFIPDLVSRVDGFGMEDGLAGACKLLQLQQPPTAIFAIADMLALGAMSAIKNAGFTIPQNIAIAGFNDIPVASLIEPPLTTVTAPARKMGQEAMKMLFSLIAGKRPPRKKEILPVSLVIRRSCGLHQ